MPAHDDCSRDYKHNKSAGDPAASHSIQARDCDAQSAKGTGGLNESGLLSSIDNDCIAGLLESLGRWPQISAWRPITGMRKSANCKSREDGP